MLRFHERWVVGVTALSLIFFRFILFFFGKTLFWGDNYSLYVPGKLFTTYWHKQGLIPWWNPTILGGITWIGDINQSIFYPSTLLFVFLRAANALNTAIIIHLLITFVGMYLFTKEWMKSRYGALIASILWTFSTQMTGSLNNGITMQSIAYVPWVLYTSLSIGTSNFGIWGTALTSSLLLWGGYPQFLIYSWLVAIPLSWFTGKINIKRFGFSWGLIGLGTMGLSAFFLLPFMEAMRESTRTIQSQAQAFAGSLNPLMGIKLILPYFWDKPTAGFKWGPAWSGQPNVFMYVTWIGLLAIIVKFIKKRIDLQDKVLLWLFSFTLILALGKYLPLYTTIFPKIPIVSWGRYPSMSLALANLLLCALVGKAIYQVRFSRQTFCRILILVIISIFIGFIAWVGLTLGSENWWKSIDALIGRKLSLGGFHTFERDRIIGLTIFSNWVTNALLFTVALFLVYKRKKSLLMLIIALDMMVNTQGMLLYANKSIYETINKIEPNFHQAVNGLKTPQVRFLTRNMNRPYSDFGMYWEAMVVRPPFSDSYVDNNERQSLNYLTRLKAGFTPDWNMPENLPLINGYTTLLPKDFAGFWSSDEQTRINFLAYIDPLSPTLKQWSGKYYLVDKAYSSSDDFAGLIKIYEDKTFSIYEIPGALPRLRNNDNKEIEYQDFSETPNKILVKTNIPVDGKIILADRYDKNWAAYIDNIETPIENCQGMRCIEVSGGDHLIEYSYQPKAFYWGLGISAVSIFMLFISYNRRR